MAVTVADLLVKLSADLSNFNKNMDGAFDKLKTAGTSLNTIGKDMTKYITVPLMAIGAVALMAAKDIAAATRTIRAQTGATGDELKNLTADFKLVFKGVPQEAKDVASAIAALHSRLSLVGKPMQDLATQSLNLAKLTNSDLVPMIGLTTRVFGDWRISSDKQAATLDYLFKVTQNTGITIDALSQKVVQFGAPLRQMGFTFEQSAAMIGQWEREGVNAELVLRSLRIGLVNFSKAGEDAPTALIAVIDKIKNMESAAKATALACKIFGARAGPDMAAAIREGRFDLDALLKTLQGSPETINVAAEATRSFSDRMAILKNKVELALEPLGKPMTNVLSSVIPYLETAAQKLAKVGEWFGELPKGIQFAVLGFLAFLAALGPALMMLAQLALALPAIGGIFAALTGPIGLVIAAVVALAGIAYLIYKNWEPIKTFFTDLWDSVKTKTAEVWDSIKTKTLEVWDAVIDAFKVAWEKIQYYVEAIGGAIVGLLLPKFTLLGISAVVNAAKVVAAWLAMQAQALATAVVYAVTVFPQLLAGWIAQGFQATVTAVKVVAAWVLMSAQAMINAVKMAAAWVIALGPVAWVSAIIVGLVALIAFNWDKVKAITIEVWTSIKDSLLGFVTTVYNIGVDIIMGLWNGISSMADWIRSKVTEFVTSIGTTIKEFFGISSPSALMAEYGAAVAEGFAEGIKNNTEKVKNAATVMAQAIVDALTIIKDNISVVIDIAQAKFDLLKAKMGENVDKAKLYAAELAMLNTQMTAHNDQIAILQKAYDDMVKIKGAAALESRKLYLELVQEQVAQANLAKQIAETNRVQQQRALTSKDIDWKDPKDVVSKYIQIAMQNAAAAGQVIGSVGGTITVGGAPIGTMPHLATGGRALAEGWAVTGEHGPELTYMPKGAVVEPLGRASGDIIFHITGNTIARDYDVDRIGDLLVRRLRREGVLV